MEQVIKALAAIPGIFWSLHCHQQDQPRYSGDVHLSKGGYQGESVSRSYHTQTSADPHDVLVELLGVASKWADGTNGDIWDPRSMS